MEFQFITDEHGNKTASIVFYDEVALQLQLIEERS